MKQYLKYLIPGAVVIIIIAWFLFKKKTPVEKEIDEVISGGRCITPPAHFEKYSGQDINWGGYANAVKELIGDYDENVSLVSSFFKGIDVQPKGAYVKYFEDEIKAYIKSRRSLPAWETPVGHFNCNSNGMFPDDVVLP